MNYINRKTELKEKVMEGSCTKQELDELYYLIRHFGSDNELEELMQSGWERSNDKLDEKKSQEILTNIRSSIDAKQRRNFFLKRTLQIAATITLLAIFFLVFDFYNPDYPVKVAMIKKETGIAEIKKTVLEDGTIVWLNANSSVTYPDSFSEGSRIVKLQGEAFFEVARDEKRPFIIQSGKFSTEVLGTSFNITSYPEDAYAVTVSTGKVKVNIHQESVLLTADQQAKYCTIDKKFISEKVNPGDFNGWRFGVLRLNGELSKALKTIERRYGVKFLFENVSLQSYEIDATYKNESLQNILKSIEFSMGVKTQLQNDTIKISKSVINH